jgi:ribonuclease HI
VLEYLARGSNARIYTDSSLLSQQFNDRWCVHDPDLRALLQKARDVIEDKGLCIEVRWIPRQDNLAGRMLDRIPPRWRRESTA